MKMNRKKISNTFKGLLVNLAIALCALLVLFFALELSLRCAGWFYSFHNRSSKGSRQVNSFRVPSTQTVLCIGDSFTQGVGAGSWEGYPQQLENLLLRSGFNDVRVVNQGIGGISSSIALKKIPEYLNNYKPKIVLLLIGVNDNWNFEDCNLFLLYRNRFPFATSVYKLINKSKVYKLFKITWFNLNNKILNQDRGKNKISSQEIHKKFNALSEDFLNQGVRELFYGRDALAIEKFKQSLEVDPKNYLAAYWVGDRYCALNEKELAREYLWQAISRCDDWNDNFASKVSNVVWRLDNQPSVTFTKVKEYLLSKYNKDKVRSVLRLFDAQLAIAKNEAMIDSLVFFNLEEIAILMKERNITLALLTYPPEKKINRIIREVALKNNIILVDNEKIFSEKLQTVKTTDYFIPDSHCNAGGYQVMTENVAEVILKNCLLD